MFKPDKECPICEAQDSVEILADETREFKNNEGKPFVVTGLAYLHCRACGEKYVNTEADKLNGPKILDAKRISEGLLPSTEITRILAKVKEKTKLSDRQIEKILDIGDRSIPRWKRDVCQSGMADAVFLLLDHDPDGIQYIAEKRGIDWQSLFRGRGRPRANNA